MFSPVGYILIPAALLLFFRGRRALLWALLFFVPFTALQVVDIGVTSIKGFQFFGVLFIARCLIDAVWSRTRRFDRSRANGLALAFLLFCVASLTMAVLKAGTVEVITESRRRWIYAFQNRVPLQLSLFNFTQLLYPTFGVLLFVFLVQEVRTAVDLKRAINILLWGVLVTAGMSFAAGILYGIGQGDIYTNLVSLFTVGPPMGGINVGFFRVKTLAGEPGFTAMTLLAGLGLVGGDVLSARTGGNSLVRFSTVKLSVIGVALLINGSTTAYFGAVLFAAWGMVALWYVRRRRKGAVIRAYLYFIGGVAVLGVTASTLQISGTPFYEWVAEYHLAKLQGKAGSGPIRLRVTLYTLEEVFTVSPILGVGYGSHRSLSLGPFLLANIGILGTSAFLAFIYVVFKNVKNTAQKVEGVLGTIAFIWTFAFVPFFGTLFIAKATSGMNFGITWAALALTEATYQVARRSRMHEQPVGYS